MLLSDLLNITVMKLPKQCSLLLPLFPRPLHRRLHPAPLPRHLLLEPPLAPLHAHDHLLQLLQAVPLLQALTAGHQAGVTGDFLLEEVPVDEAQDGPELERCY